MLLAALRLPKQPVRLGAFSLRGLGFLLNPGWIVFVGSVFLLGLSFIGIFTFVSVSMRAMGGTESLIGISWTMAAFLEIPIMLLGARWPIREHDHCLYL